MEAREVRETVRGMLADWDAATDEQREAMLATARAGAELAQAKLADDTVYVAGDRFVCAVTGCAGMTARATGRDIDGHLLRPVDERDLAEWASYGLGALKCECGRVTAA